MTSCFKRFTQTQMTYCSNKKLKVFKIASTIAIVFHGWMLAISELVSGRGGVIANQCSVSI